MSAYDVEGTLGSLVGCRRVSALVLKTQFLDLPWFYRILPLGDLILNTVSHTVRSSYTSENSPTYSSDVCYDRCLLVASIIHSHPFSTVSCSMEKCSSLGYSIKQTLMDTTQTEAKITLFWPLLVNGGLSIG